MAKYRYIYTNFWEDPKVSETFTPEDKLFLLYLLTNSHTTQIGIYKTTPKFMAFELGYSIESINSLLARFEEHHKLIRYNRDTHELALKEWGKINLNKGGTPIECCIKSEFSKVEDKSLLTYVMDSIKNSSVKQLFINELEKYAENKTVDDDTYHDTSTIREKEKTRNTLFGKLLNNAESNDTYHDTPTIRGENENKNENINEKEDIYSNDKKANDDLDSGDKTANYKTIVSLYNKICKSLPEVTAITENRKSALQTSCKTFKDIKIFYELFSKAEKSEFLSGSNGKWTACNFDWLVNESNMVKVLEGTYDNKNTSAGYKKTTFNDYEQRSYDYDDLEDKLLARNASEFENQPLDKNDNDEYETLRKRLIGQN